MKKQPAPVDNIWRLQDVPPATNQELESRIDALQTRIEDRDTREFIMALCLAVGAVVLFFMAI